MLLLLQVHALNLLLLLLTPAHYHHLIHTLTSLLLLLADVGHEALTTQYLLLLLYLLTLQHLLLLLLLVLSWVIRIGHKHNIAPVTRHLHMMIKTLPSVRGYGSGNETVLAIDCLLLHITQLRLLPLGYLTHNSATTSD